MKRKWLTVLGLALVLATVGVMAGCAPGEAVIADIEGLTISNQQEGIWVTGLGKISVVPDVATLSLGIEAQAATVVEAQALANDAMNKVMAALTGNGVAQKDIQTQYFSIYQVTRWDKDQEKEVVIGYRVTNIVTAKIRDVAEAGIVIDAVAVAGGDLTRINGIGFSVDNPSDYYEQVREQAMADAEAKAEQLASLAGVNLGKPTYISESTQVPPIIRGPVYEAAPATGTPISPGETEISLTVQVTYSIQ